MNAPLQRKPDGRYKTIHNHGVLEVETYRGWAIRYHWGGWQGFKASRVLVGQQIVTDAYPLWVSGKAPNGDRIRMSGKLKVRHAIDVFEDKYPE